MALSHMVPDGDGETAKRPPLNDDIRMRLEVRTYGGIREAVGDKTVEVDVSDGSTVSDVLDALGPPRQLSARDPDLIIMVNGRNVSHLNGAATVLETGDRVTLSDAPVRD